MPIDKTVRSLARIAGLAAMLAGCSEYTDHRDTISLNGGNAIATNIVTQTVDPWPAVSADKNIAFNGQKMQSAVQRYRTGTIIQPASTGTSGTYQQQQGSSGNPTPADPSGGPPPAPKSP